MRLPLATALTVLVTAGVSLTAEARTRDQVMKDAAAFAEHAWDMKAANQQGKCTGSYKSDHALGKNTGLPYAWGGFMSISDFDKRIAAGDGAGSHSKDGVLSCVAGVDCSGFVSQVWQLPSKQGTSTLSSVTTPIKTEELKPGDALNKAGSHVVLWAGTASDGRPVIYEASGSASRVRMYTPNWSYLSGYQPVRYNKIEETAVAATTPVTPPVAAPAAKPAMATATATTAPAAKPATATATAPATTVTPAAATAQPAPAAKPAVATQTAAPAQPAAATQPAVATQPAAAAQPATTTAVAAPAAQPAPAGNRVTLAYGKDVGFQAGAQEEQAIGPDYLSAGPSGQAAVYDRVRRQVLILDRKGIKKSFEVGHADGIGFTNKGDVLVMDGSTHQTRVYDSSGKSLRTIEMPQKGIFGALHLEDGMLYATTPDGQRKAVAELSDGFLRPVRKSFEVPKDIVKLADKLPNGGPRQVDVNGEKLAVPESVRVSGRPMRGWVELVLASTDARGTVSVNRSLRRPGQAVALPSGEQGTYDPVADLAVDESGSAVYLDPGNDAVAVVWVDPTK